MNDIENKTLPFKTGNEHDFLAELEELLAKYSGGDHYYRWVVDTSNGDIIHGLRFEELSVGGFNTDNEDSE